MTEMGEARAAHDRMQSINVVMVEPVGGHGGMDFWNRSMCNALALEGWRSLLLTSQAMRDPTDAHEVWEVYRGVFGPDPKWRRGVRHVAATVRGLWRGRKLGARLVHFHFFHVGLLQCLGIVFAHLIGMKVVVSAHDVGSFRAGESTWLLQRLYRVSEAIIVYSSEGRRMLTEAFNVPDEKIFVAPHGNYNKFLPPLPLMSEAKASFGYHANDFVLLFFGQLKRVKRLDLLLKATALARVCGEGRIRLLVAGGAADSDITALRKIIDEENLNDFVKLHIRYIDNSELPKYFAASDLAVLPYDHIYQSGVVLLAMSNEVPVLTSDIPGMLGVIEHGRTGLTFRAGDARDLADRLLEAERGEWDLSSLASTAREVASTRHSWNNTARVTIDAYRAATADARDHFVNKSQPTSRGAS